MRYLILFLFLVIGLFGCDNTSNDNAGSAYLGGEIINPKSDHVMVFNKDMELSDTLKLDANNRFIHKIENVKPGVYSFFHGGEVQLVILEPNDSIMFRLNTYDFDESLVFTGEGARKNNYLIKLFVENEIERKKLMKYAQKEPEYFIEFIDKKYESAVEKFENFIAKKDMSDFAKHIIKSNIDYHHFAKREIYPFAYFGNNKLVHVMDLPEDFYDFRSEINYNDIEINESYDYNLFLSAHIDNLALENYYKTKAYHSTFDRHEINYNLAKLELVDSLITNPTIKNNLLRNKTYHFINNVNSDEEINIMFNHYLAKSTSEDDKNYMRKQVESIKKLRPGYGIPSLKIQNVKDETYTISEVVNRPTLIYFWSSNNIQHYRNSHYRARELREKFPEMAFLSINTDNNLDKYWKNTLNKYKFSLKDEYRFVNPEESLKSLAIGYVFKVIIVDKNSNIVHPNANIFNDDFEILLEELKLKKELSF
ncbi:hypothetical protein [Winogradskyella sp. A3E31]|uniref:hypothetical protein n=1 Tax=Winogradskyella sp. A3E31 TaxID=3349637 RepID=UPI00398BB6EE